MEPRLYGSFDNITFERERAPFSTISRGGYRSVVISMIVSRRLAPPNPPEPRG